MKPRYPLALMLALLSTQAHAWPPLLLNNVYITVARCLESAQTPAEKKHCLAPLSEEEKAIFTAELINKETTDDAI